jgi:methylated-DNA-[protein]-cysteine S-methyltransferase
MICLTTTDSPIGPLRLVATESALIGTYMHERGPEIPGAVEQRNPVLELAAGQLGEYFAGKREAFELPLEPQGTEFQRAVWAALSTIPFGVTWSYAQLAKRIGKPNAVRAVGTANGSNPISIIIPCHRVIGSDGSLTGYGGGLPRKRWLLAHEKTELPLGA